MNRSRRRLGAANSMYVLLIGSLVVLVGIGVLLVRGTRRGPQAAADKPAGTTADKLFVYCAAGLRVPVEKIAAEYEREQGVPVQIQYGGSATLLGQLEVSKTGDLFLAGDESYAQQAHAKGLIQEQLPVARMRPVLDSTTFGSGLPERLPHGRMTGASVAG